MINVKAWTDSLSFGEPTVDTQHMAMFDALCEIFKVLETPPVSFDVIAELLDQLFTISSEHYQYEEKLMLSTGYIGYDSHRKEHVRFQRNFLKLRNALSENGVTPELSDDINTYIADWVFTHTSGADKFFARYYKEKVKAETSN